MKISFASDNNAPVHPAVLEALTAVNQWSPAYGADDSTDRFERKVRELFGGTAQGFLVFNGTGANVLGLSAMMKPFESVIAPQSAHLQVDECGALERFAGIKLMTVETEDGKLRPSQLEPWLGYRGDQHRVQPRVISITQATEWGTLYTAEEVRVLADFAHSRGLLLHMDGARFANAAAALGLSLQAASADLGVDVLSFGGTKNGILVGEAVIFFNQPEMAHAFPFIRKQGMQLGSKMQYLAAQFLTLWENDLWLRNAQHANAMALRLESRLSEISGIRIMQKVQVNMIFATLPAARLARVLEKFYFYVLNSGGSGSSGQSLARLMTSFNTRSEDVDALADALADALDDALL